MPRRCNMQRVRCYLPSAVAGAVLLWLTAYGVYVMRGREIEAIGARQVVNGLLLWFVLSPVIIGVLRGARRSARHLTRPR